MKITFYTKISPFLVIINYIILVYTTFIILFGGFDIIDWIINPIKPILCLIFFNLAIIIFNKKKHRDDFSIISYLVFVVIIPEIIIIISNVIMCLLSQILFNFDLA